MNSAADRPRERVLAVSVHRGADDRVAAEYSLEELRDLIATAGGEYCGAVVFRRERFDPAGIIGTGQISELAAEAERLDAATLVFDINDIRPVQYRNLEEATQRKILSRCDVILDIFAMRASSAEAKIQVELAALNNMLPRIRGRGLELSRLGGGIGTRGPGETQLETDRRHIFRRIHALEKKLTHIEQTRSTKRKSRSDAVTVAVAGYTNAGKSTLINRIAKKQLLAENRLFATLDSYTRSAWLAPGVSVLLTDTVGFIRNLPASLVKAFRSTFEEIVRSEIIIHVVDIAAHDWKGNITVVNAELDNLGAAADILFFNKADAAPEQAIAEARMLYPDAIFGSARTGEGLDSLKSTLTDRAISPQKTKPES